MCSIKTRVIDSLRQFLRTITGFLLYIQKGVRYEKIYKRKIELLDKPGTVETYN